MHSSIKLDRIPRGGLHNAKMRILSATFLLIISSGQSIAERRVNTAEGNVSSKLEIKMPPGLKVPPEWKPLVDPLVDEFWNEGSYKPDAGFVIWAKNPTLENAKLYLVRMNAKRDRLHVMQKQQEQANKELIKQGIISNDYNFLSEATSTRILQGTIKDSQIFFFFNPTCSYCKKQAQILVGNSNIIPMQIGGTELLHFQELPPSIWATKEDIERYAADKVVPILLIYDRKTNNMASVKGVHTIREIEQITDRLRKEATKR